MKFPEDSVNIQKAIISRWPRQMESISEEMGNEVENENERKRKGGSKPRLGSSSIGDDDKAAAEVC